jgi:hypothetical protein
MLPPCRKTTSRTHVLLGSPCMESRSTKFPVAQAWCGLVAAILAALGGSNLWDVLRRVPPPPHYVSAAPTDVVMRHEQRFAPVLAALRARRVRGRVGYLADQPPQAMQANPRGMQEYFLTQFALVPVVLDTNLENCTWLVTNLRETTLDARVPAGFQLVDEFGDGVSLLRRKEPL